MFSFLTYPTHKAFIFLFLFIFFIQNNLLEIVVLFSSFRSSEAESRNITVWFMWLITQHKATLYLQCPNVTYNLKRIYKIKYYLSKKRLILDTSKYLNISTWFNYHSFLNLVIALKIMSYFFFTHLIIIEP